MSDDRTNDPSPYGHAPDAGASDATSRAGDDGTPPPPAYDAPAAPPPPAPAYGAGSYGAPSFDAAPPAPPAPSYGEQAYGQQGYGAPAYGYNGVPRVNPLAIVALVSSLVGLFVIPVIGQIAGIITGHISLKQIKTTGERGRGMALSGVLIGYISLGLGILLIILTAVIIATTGGSDVRYGA